MYQFQAFNRSISSVIHFPELLISSVAPASSDIQITYGNVESSGLNDSQKSGAFFQANERHFWLNIPHIARFLVSDGQHIVIDACNNVNEENLRVFILESCFKALLSQQNIIVLEGSAIKVGSYAILFVMPSGYGKSTLCSLFLKKGYQILTDEICAIRKDDYLEPSYPAINLWSNISRQLSIDLGLLNQVRPCVEKYRMDLDLNFYSDPLPIKLIYTIDYHKKETFSVTEIPRNMKRHELMTGLFIPPFVTQPPYLDEFAHSIPIIKLTCPRWDYSLNQMGYLLDREIDRIEQDVMERMECHEPL